MNPQQELFCPEIECPARGQVGKGNIHVHSLKDKRCICDVCGKTFATTSGTIFYRLRTNPVTVMLVLSLLAYGCPVQAIVKAFGLAQRTVRDWQQRAGNHVTRLMDTWQKTANMIWKKCKRMKSKQKHSSARFAWRWRFGFLPFFYRDKLLKTIVRGGRVEVFFAVQIPSPYH